MSGPNLDIVEVLRGQQRRAAVAAEIAETLRITPSKARAVVDAFETFVVFPLDKRLKKVKGADLRKRNPLIYTVRGVSTIHEWVRRFVEDQETSAIEAHMGTFMEEVARIVSGGFKPAGGVDLQVERDGTVRLYAIQTAPNTKNSGSRHADVLALKKAALPLRAARRHVELSIAVLHGRNKAGIVGWGPEVTMPSSDEFWNEISGVEDFRAHLLQASVSLARLVRAREAGEIDRLEREASRLFGAADGSIDVAAVSASRKRVTAVASKSED